ncbi:hypothetical protein SKAU_G00267130 [Synaphobranchus kaupii]|uniref:FCP1 homology domain-containing protein n=1 Tax=Synaphobranchus kaupii TaxID=118154 RepID=A0A9Q1EZV0_SYNKA|nr:hypothetical protein SKAU_G00267130 [Synaphobranchus kaupii]
MSSLQTAYEDYDIVIWSATSMKWIDAKMKVMCSVTCPLMASGITALSGVTGAGSDRQPQLQDHLHAGQRGHDHCAHSKEGVWWR